MKPPTDRTRNSADDGKKSASRQGEMDTGEWEPETTELRDGKHPDRSSHAKRNLANIKQGYRSLLPDPGALVETPHQTYRVTSETTVDDRPAVHLTTKYGTQELYRLHFDDPGDGPLLEYHAPDRKTSAALVDSLERSWTASSRQVTWPGYQDSDRDA